MKRSVWQALALIMQLGISIIVPVGLCVALGVFLDNKFGWYSTVPLMILGMAAGVRNVYKILKGFIHKDDRKDEDGNGLS